MKISKGLSVKITKEVYVLTTPHEHIKSTTKLQNNHYGNHIKMGT